MFAGIIILGYLSRSQYQKVLLICEAKNTPIEIWSKILLYVQVIVSTLIYSSTNIYLNLNPEIEDILNNMAGLFILNEFDQFLGNIFEIKVVKYVPQAFNGNLDKVVDTFS